MVGVLQTCIDGRLQYSYRHRESHQERRFEIKMGLYKRGKWYHCSYTIHFPDGRVERVRKPLYKRKKVYATEEYRRILNSLDDGSYFEREVPSIKEVIERYMAEVSPLQGGHGRNQEIAANWYAFFECVDFFEDEFTRQRMDPDKLSVVLSKLYGIGNRGPGQKSLDWINNALEIPDLYERVVRKNRKLAERGEVKILKDQVGKIGSASFRDLPADKQLAIKRVNRLTIELAHVKETPQSTFWGECPVSAVTKSMLSTYKSRRLLGKIVHGRGKGRVAGASTVKRELSFLRAVLNYAIDEWDDDWEGYFRDYTNPVGKVIKRLEDEERNRTITPEEARELNKTIPSWLKPMVIMASQTGYRRANIVLLELSEVLFDRNVISIPAKKMKKKNPSVKKMTKLVRETLKTAIENRTGSTNYVFTNESGEPYSPQEVTIAFSRACKAAGIKDLRFHDLKRDFGTLLAENDVEGFKRQQYLDHLDPRMTQKYTSWQPSMLDAIDTIEGKGIGPILAQPPDENDQNEGGAVS